MCRMSSTSTKSLMCYCFFGGRVALSPNGTYTYEGGSTEEFLINPLMNYDLFANEVCDHTKIGKDRIVIRYSIQNHQCPPIIMRTEIDYNNFIHFNEDAVDIYVFEIGNCSDYIHATIRSSQTVDPSANGVLNQSRSQTISWQLPPKFIAYDIEFPYKQAWRAKELVKELINGHVGDSYKQLPWYCERIKESNHESVAKVTWDEQNRMGSKVLFYLPLQQMLIMACFQWLLAFGFAVVVGESYRDWHWFLTNLMFALEYQHDDLIIVFNRHQNIISTVGDVFGSVLHAHCFLHLEQNVLAHIRGDRLGPCMKDDLKTPLWKTTCARLGVDYDRGLNEVNCISSNAYSYLIDQKPEHWVVSKFPQRRFNLMNSNHVESFNSWIREAHDMSILTMIDTIRMKMMKLLDNRRKCEWKCPVGPLIDEDLQAKLDQSVGLTYTQSSTTEYEVRGGEVNHYVNTQTRSCTCMDWHHSGLSCVHGCAVLKRQNLDPYSYVDDYFKREAQEKICSEGIRPMATWDMPSLTGDEFLEQGAELRPPITRVCPGRRKKRHIESQDLENRPLHCGRCGLVCHNHAMCMAALNQ
ncbi:hypothetical protein IFM89_008044 [Coptis chinensis]|uniref:SWIM-type domain-containing protein n=1 Tax=Coptis chinensis TaxID=261450 RepID=A0A835LRA7_9MAGN|nr:hypothetical protein IFM89_008044 [Coptis chinensis]